MSNIELIFEERARHIGDFLVGRLIPFSQKRMVGPFAFIDHMGPATLDEHNNFDVPPHPHIGLSTLTYLFDGTILHKDSLGTGIEIRPGQVNWMTAGKGIVHSERTPDRLRGSEKSLHGLQIWVALPTELEQMDPSFVHVGEQDIPAWEEDGAAFKLIAGEAFGRKSPVPVYSPLYFLEIKSAGQPLSVSPGEALFGESALYILSGQVRSEGHVFGPKQILVARNSKLCAFEMDPDTTIFIFGGEPFPEGRHIDWNFVASDPELIAAAKERWLRQEFPPVPGETEFVPLPKTTLRPR